jgi:CRISPR-associated protein Cmr6
MNEPIRPVCKDVNAAIGKLPNSAFNFGLYFQKWFYVSSENWKCHTHTPKKAASKESDLLLDNLAVSLKLFNRETVQCDGASVRWKHNDVQEILDRRHKKLDQYALAFEKLGYEHIKFAAILESPLIIGLGNEHPTEKGFRFDWTSGIPSIPASSIKGVVRLAYIVNKLNGMDDGEAQAFAKNLTLEKERLDGQTQEIFGDASEKISLRGKVIFLDAYPATLPMLKAEIMNCHYPEYFEGERGPTEDQRLNPQKYWAVAPYTDTRGSELKFVFRFFVHKELCSQKEYASIIVEAIKVALHEHGLGAKTAIGHGRFSFDYNANVDSGSACVSVNNQIGIHVESTAAQNLKKRDIWERANLKWEPGPRRTIASLAGKKAECNGNELVPKALHKQLIERRKSVVAKVHVEPVGNSFTIVKIEVSDQSN